MITPRNVIEKYSTEEICQGADDYFKSLNDISVLLGKPFNSVYETPGILEDVGVLLAGLRLAKTMTVLDFGAGSCWLSRILTQLQCRAIACDPSQTALEIGKRLHREYPAPVETIFEPQFLHFNGHEIDLPDKSVDRICCFDAFHHVPNQEQILKEMGRVLKDGGIAGFREPGVRHSQSAVSQAEMNNHVVLENDIDVNQIFATAKKYGFTVITFRLQGRTEISLDQYNELMQVGKRSRWHKAHNALQKEAMENLRFVMESRSVFLLFKGATVLDSRSVEGLQCRLAVDNQNFQVMPSSEQAIPLTIHNTGSASWLNQNTKDIGVVKIVAHLYDESGKLVDFDFLRQPIEHVVKAGESLATVIKLRFNQSGTFQLKINLLAEQVVWFEHLGCAPAECQVIVQ